MAFETARIMPDGTIKYGFILTEEELENLPEVDQVKYGETLERLRRERDEYLERTKGLDKD